MSESSGEKQREKREFTGLSLTAFGTAGDLEDFLLRDLKKTESRGDGSTPPVSPVFELSYKMDEEYLRRSAALEMKAVSVHAPCPHTSTLPNLGSRDPKVLTESYTILEESAKTAAVFGADILVLHAGYATDRRIYTDSEERRKSLEEAPPPPGTYIYKHEGMISTAEYCDAPEYRVHLEETIKNLPRAIEICRSRGVTLAVENINPRITYLMQQPEDLFLTAERVPEVRFCLDIGHLWISSLIHSFHYLETIERILDTRRVVTTHLHNNYSTSGKPETVADDHLSLNRGELPYREVVELLVRKGPGRFIIEAKECPGENLQILRDLIQSFR